MSDKRSLHCRSTILQQWPFVHAANLTSFVAVEMARLLLVVVLQVLIVSQLTRGQIVYFTAEDYGTWNETRDNFVELAVRKVGYNTLPFGVIIEVSCQNSYMLCINEQSEQGWIHVKADKLIGSHHAKFTATVWKQKFFKGFAKVCLQSNP